MWGKYLWDTGTYIPCEGELVFGDVFATSDFDEDTPDEIQP
jgi:hypothetical protein